MNDLLDIAEKLLSPEGCAWDRQQTLETLKPYLLEEAHEVVEAIDLNDFGKIVEEVGDVLYALVFIAKLLEPKHNFNDCVKAVSEKLVRRHPHVFGDLKGATVEEIKENWEKIKKQEGKKSPIEGIAPTLPALSRSQKVIHKLKKEPLLKERIEEGIGQKLWDLVKEAEELGIDAEGALRKVCLAYEQKHRR